MEQLLSAAEAKAIATKNAEMPLKEILYRIEEAAKKGNTEYKFTSTKIKNWEAELTGLGYELKDDPDLLGVYTLVSWKHNKRSKKPTIPMYIDLRFLRNALQGLQGSGYTMETLLKLALERNIVVGDSESDDLYTLEDMRKCFNEGRIMTSMPLQTPKVKFETFEAYIESLNK